jgi:TonB family protein
VRTAILMFLICVPISGIAQTVTILNMSIAKEPHLGARSVGVELSILNDKKVPIALSNRIFYLRDDHEAEYLPLSRMNNTDTSFNVQLDPGSKISQQLWFEVPAALDWQKLKLCLHAPDNKSWDDYLEIPFSMPTAATAPMWHPVHLGDPLDSKAYVGQMAPGGVPALTPPRLTFAPDPKVPPGGTQHIKDAGGKILSIVSLIVDREGHPQQVQVVSAAGMGFDLEALKAVSQYRFKPALDRNGNPVAVKVFVEVKFRTY